MEHNFNNLIKIYFRKINANIFYRYRTLSNETFTSNYVISIIENFNLEINDDIYFMILVYALSYPKPDSYLLVNYIISKYNPTNFYDMFTKIYDFSFSNILPNDGVIDVTKDDYYSNDKTIITSLFKTNESILRVLKNHSNFREIIRNMSNGCTFLFYIKHLPIEVIKYILHFMLIYDSEIFDVLNKDGNSLMTDLIFTKFNYEKLCLYTKIIDNGDIE